MSKVILITGSNRGIGFEIARQCGLLGNRIVISGRNEERLKAALNNLRKISISADYLLMDVSDPESIKEAAEQFALKNQRISVIVNNAGINLENDRSLIKNEWSILERTIRTNSYGPLLVTKYFLKFIESPGRIIMISSESGVLNGNVGGWCPSYCVSKTLLNSITKQLAYELSPKSISVNAVSPGWVKTELGGKDAPRSVEKGAETPVWLATEASQALTGLFLRDKKPIEW